MKASEAKIGSKYKSNVNIFANNLEYEIIKKFKTACWVLMWEEGKKTNTIYKGVPYSVLKWSRVISQLFLTPW